MKWLENISNWGEILIFVIIVAVNIIAFIVKTLKAKVSESPVDKTIDDYLQNKQTREIKRDYYEAAVKEIAKKAQIPIIPEKTIAIEKEEKIDNFIEVEDLNVPQMNYQNFIRDNLELAILTSQILEPRRYKKQ